MVLDSISKGLSSPQTLRECVFLLHLFSLQEMLKGTWPHILMCVHTKLLQLCPTLCDPMDYSPLPHPPGSSVLRILQARILEWIAMPSSTESSQPRRQIRVSYISCTGRQVLYHQGHPGSPQNLTEGNSCVTNGIIGELFKNQLRF